MRVWPATLKGEALAFYRGSRAVDAVRAATAAGWIVEPRPHLAFWRASVGQRVHLTAAVDALTYARQLTDGDVSWVGGWPVEALRSDLMPWLVSRGYAAPGDADGLDQFERLAAARGGAHLRMAMRFTHEQAAELTPEMGELLGHSSFSRAYST